jgi:hypothetical protein
VTKVERYTQRVLKLVKKWRREASNWPDAFPHELKLYRAVIKLEEAEMLERVERTGEPKQFPLVYCPKCKRKHRSNYEHRK